MHEQKTKLWKQNYEVNSQKTTDYIKHLMVSKHAGIKNYRKIILRFTNKENDVALS